MDEHDVDGVEAEALERKFERPHHAVVGVIEALAARRRFEECALQRALLRLADVEQPADLGRDQIGIARLRTQEAVQSRFRKSEPVERRGVEIAAAGGPYGLERQPRLLLGHRPIEVAERPAAEPEFGEAQLRAAAGHELPDARASPIRGRHRERPSRSTGQQDRRVERPQREPPASTLQAAARSASRRQAGPQRTRWRIVCRVKEIVLQSPLRVKGAARRES